MNWKIVTRGWGRRLPVIFRHDINVSKGTSFPFKLENIDFFALNYNLWSRHALMSPTAYHW